MAGQLEGKDFFQSLSFISEEQNPDQLKAVLSFKQFLLMQILQSCSEQDLMLL